MSHRSASVVASHGKGIMVGLSARSAMDPNAFGPPGWDTRSRAIAGGMLGGLAGFVYGEHLLARAMGRRLAIAMPGGAVLWRMAAHGAALAGLVAGGNALWNRAMRGLELGALSTRLVEPGSRRVNSRAAG
jgi:hypothetical protein